MATKHQYHIKDWALLGACVIGGGILIGLAVALQSTLLGFVEAHPWFIGTVVAGLCGWAYRSPAKYHD